MPPQRITITKLLTLLTALFIIYNFFFMKWLDLGLFKLSAHQSIQQSYQINKSKEVYLLYLIPLCSILICMFEYYANTKQTLNNIMKLFCALLILFFGYYIWKMDSPIIQFHYGYYLSVLASFVFIKDLLTRKKARLS